MSFRHSCIKHFSEISEPDNAHYPGSDELLTIGAAFSKFFGLKRLGIHHEILKPGRRSSWPHAEKTEEEFIFVIEGTPQVWIDGELFALNPGDGVGFNSGTGLAHTFINNSSWEVRLLVVGESTKADNQIYYPLHPQRNETMGEGFWRDGPKAKLGPHDGLPDQQKFKDLGTKIEIDDGLFLTEIRESDRAAFLAAFKTDDIFKHTQNIPFPYVDRDFDFWLAYVQTRTQINGRVVQFGIRNTSGKIIGAIGFDRLIIGESHQAELGYWLSMEHWGTGIMTKAVRKICQIAQDEFQVIRINALVFASNIASQKVLQKSGFSQEGKFKKYFFKEGEFKDAIQFALV